MPMAMLRGKSRTEIRRPMTVCHTGLSKLWTPVGGHRLAAAGGLVDVVDRGVKMRPHLSSTSTYGDADPTLSAGQFEFESRDYAVTRSIRRPRPCFFVTARKALVAHRCNFIDREI